MTKLQRAHRDIESMYRRMRNDEMLNVIRRTKFNDFNDLIRWCREVASWDYQSMLSLLSDVMHTSYDFDSNERARVIDIMLHDYNVDAALLNDSRKWST